MKTKNSLKVIISLLFLTIILTVPYLVFGQEMSSRLDTVAKIGGYGDNLTLPEFIGIIISVVLSLLGSIFIVLMVFAGFSWMTASGEEAKITKAKNMIQTSLIGLVIVLSSWAIWNFVLQRLIFAS